MQLVWQGYYLDGKSAARRAATIELQASNLHITLDGGAVLQWPYDEIVQTQGAYAGEQVRLERGGEFGEVLLIADKEFLTALHWLAPNRAAKFHNPKDRPARWRATIVAGAVSVAALIVIYLYGLPALATAVTPWVPVSWEEQLGAAVVEHVARPASQCNDPARRQVIDDLLAKLIASVPDNPYKFRVLIVNDPTINALAAPGGYIVIFRGLLEATRTPEELAGILAHELQHVLKRHSTKLLLQHVSTGLLMAAFLGDVSGVASFGLDAAQTLVLLRYSRGYEIEADEEGLKMLNAAAIDTRGIISFFKTMKQKESDSPAILKYLASHPDTGDRIARLESLAGDPKISKFPPLMYDWSDVKKVCSTVGAG